MHSYRNYKLSDENKSSPTVSIGEDLLLLLSMTRYLWSCHPFRKRNTKQTSQLQGYPGPLSKTRFSVVARTIKSYQTGELSLLIAWSSPFIHILKLFYILYLKVSVFLLFITLTDLPTTLSQSIFKSHHVYLCFKFLFVCSYQRRKISLSSLSIN